MDDGSECLLFLIVIKISTVVSHVDAWILGKEATPATQGLKHHHNFDSPASDV